jgi:hypothetical protein
MNDLSDKEMTKFRAQAEKMGMTDSALIAKLIRQFLRDPAK